MSVRYIYKAEVTCNSLECSSKLDVDINPTKVHYEAKERVVLKALSRESWSTDTVEYGEHFRNYRKEIVHHCPECVEGYANNKRYEMWLELQKEFGDVNETTQD